MVFVNGFYFILGVGMNEVCIVYVLNQDLLKKVVKCLEEVLKVYFGKIV